MSNETIYITKQNCPHNADRGHQYEYTPEVNV